MKPSWLHLLASHRETSIRQGGVVGGGIRMHTGCIRDTLLLTVRMHQKSHPYSLPDFKYFLFRERYYFEEAAREKANPEYWVSQVL